MEHSPIGKYHGPHTQPNKYNDASLIMFSFSDPFSSKIVIDGHTAIRFPGELDKLLLQQEGQTKASAGSHPQRLKWHLSNGKTGRQTDRQTLFGTSQLRKIIIIIIS